MSNQWHQLQIKMRVFIFFILAIPIFISCNTQKEKKSCSYGIDKLFNDYDTSVIDKGYFDTGASFEVLDKGGSTGARGLYRFDQNSTLRFYAFLLTGKNDYTFSIEYDSLGYEIKKTGNDVVHWYFRKVGLDSFRVTFYLFSINREYTEIQLSTRNDQFREVELFTSPIFSNVLGGTVTYPIQTSNTNIIFKGVRINTCLNETEIIKDSVSILNVL